MHTQDHLTANEVEQIRWKFFEFFTEILKDYEKGFPQY